MLKEYFTHLIRIVKGELGNYLLDRKPLDREGLRHRIASLGLDEDQNVKEYDTDDPGVRLGEKLEHVRITLCFHLIQIREDRGISRKEMADRLSVDTDQVEKIEHPDHPVSLESVIRYLHELDADLDIAIDRGDESVQITEKR